MKKISPKIVCLVLCLMTCLSLSGCKIGEYNFMDLYWDEDGLHFMGLGKRGPSGSGVETMDLDLDGLDGFEEPDPLDKKSSDRKFFNGHTSYFDNYTGRDTLTAHEVEGRVYQENDEHAHVVYIDADEDTTINVKGSLKRVKGHDTELVYVSEDGTRTKIADNSSGTFDTRLDVSKGTGKVVFSGKSAVYDFKIEFEFADGVNYRMR